jgi:hypothetical protein
VLDAAQDRLWSVDVSSGAATLLADSGTVPPLDGCYSLHIVSESVTGAVYSLSYELLDNDSIDDSPGVLKIVDLDVTASCPETQPRRKGIDGMDLGPPTMAA